MVRFVVVLVAVLAWSCSPDKAIVAPTGKALAVSEIAAVVDTSHCPLGITSEASTAFVGEPWSYFLCWSNSAYVKYPAWTSIALRYGCAVLEGTPMEEGVYRIEMDADGIGLYFINFLFVIEGDRYDSDIVINQDIGDRSYGFFLESLQDEGIKRPVSLSVEGDVPPSLSLRFTDDASTRVGMRWERLESERDNEVHHFDFSLLVHDAEGDQIEEKSIKMFLWTENQILDAYKNQYVAPRALEVPVSGGVCDVGQRLSPGQHCVVEIEGVNVGSDKFEVGADGKGCYGNICSGQGLILNGFSVQRVDGTDDWIILAVP